MQIRRLSPLDAPAYHALRMQGLVEQALAFGASPFEEQNLSAAQQAARLEATPQQAIFGAFDEDEQLLAVVSFKREHLQKLSHKGLIWGMYCAPQARGQGIGKALLHTLLAYARSLEGMRQVFLVVNETQHAAIKMYQALGFSVFGREEDAMLIDGEMQVELHMHYKF
jgi:ribosomal protein S18 acetylase RimI-like enzyme